MRVLHALHEFQPPHQARVFELAQAQRALGLRVHLLRITRGPAASHGTLRWRIHEGLGVTELIDNRAASWFRERSAYPLIRQQLRHILNALGPELVHVHTVPNVSSDLPAIAEELGIHTAATLHDDMFIEHSSIEEDAATWLRTYRELLGVSTDDSAIRRKGRDARTAAVVLNFRTADDTTLALASLQASRRPFRDVIVVDNGSGDGSDAVLRASADHTTFIANATNLGFSGGCNVGIRTALARGADRVLLLNSDAILSPDALQRLEDVLDHDPAAGIAGPAIASRANPEQLVSRGIRFSPTTGRMRFIGYREPANASPDARVEVVDAVSGCAMLIAHEVIDRIGLLAEDYFFGFEDVDYCLRARAAGYTTVCVPSATALHGGSASIGLRSPQRIYFATRNHLLLGSRLQPTGPAAWIRACSTVALNLAHALVTSDVPRAQALRAFGAGVYDHLRGRYGRPTSLGERSRKADEPI